MKLFGLEIRKKQKEVRNKMPEYVSNFSDALYFGSNSANNSAMSLSAVYRAVDIISSSIAILPIKIKINNQTHKDEITNHPLQLVFDSMLLSRFNFMKLLVESVMLKGNAYAYIHRNNNGIIKNVEFVECSDVTINYNKVKKELYYYIPKISSKRIEPCNIIHLILHTNDGVNGVSILSHARRSLGIANATENSASNFFDNGCNLSGVLTVQGQLTAQQRNDIRASWNQAYQSGGNGLAVLQGNMSYQPISLSAADSQMLESRTFNVQDIARFFGISPILLGDLTHSSFSTLEAVQNQFLLHTLCPYISMIEQEFTRKLILPSESNISINLDETALMKADKTVLASYYSTLLSNGVMCINEVRAEMGLSPVEGGDKHIIPYTNVEQNSINKTESEIEDDNKEVVLITENNEDNKDNNIGEINE